MPCYFLAKAKQAGSSFIFTVHTGEWCLLSNSFCQNVKLKYCEIMKKNMKNHSNMEFAYFTHVCKHHVASMKSWNRGGADWSAPSRATEDSLNSLDSFSQTESS